jgi:SAM-dependent methyltransferase
MEALRHRIQRMRHPARLGRLRRTTPLSEEWGRDRGTPVDRFFIERFLERERQCIRGHVVELLNSDYTRRYGTGVDRTDVLDVDPSNADATIIADLAAADEIPSQTFDCFILTQTLQFVPDVRAAIRHVHRTLKPGGKVLCTVPAVSRIARRTLDTEYWRFTVAGCKFLFGETFGSECVRVESFGNVLTSIAFLTGMAAEELSDPELDHVDPFFPLLVAVVAERGPGVGAEA